MNNRIVMIKSIYGTWVPGRYVKSICQHVVECNGVNEVVSEFRFATAAERNDYYDKQISHVDDNMSALEMQREFLMHARSEN